MELFWPVKPGVITQKFGGNGEWYRKNGIPIDGHNGIDIYTDHGTPVRAAHDGVVSDVWRDDKGGYGVIIQTTDTRYARHKTIYWHLCPPLCHFGKHRTPVVMGQVVSVGEVIGYADNTGLSTGDHLHFGLKAIDERGETINKDNGYLGAIDPLPYMGMFAEDYMGFRRKLFEISEKLRQWLKK